MPWNWEDSFSDQLCQRPGGGVGGVSLSLQGPSTPSFSQMWRWRLGGFQVCSQTQTLLFPHFFFSSLLPYESQGARPEREG